MFFIVMQPNIQISKDYSTIKIKFFRPLRAEENSPDKNNNTIMKFIKHIQNSPVYIVLQSDSNQIMEFKI